MFESQEVINLFLSLALYLFLLSLLRKLEFKLPPYWIGCLTFIVFGEFFTVLEGVAFPYILNVLEHVSFTLACLYFFIAVLSMRQQHG